MPYMRNGRTQEGDAQSGCAIPNLLHDAVASIHDINSPGTCFVFFFPEEAGIVDDVWTILDGIDGNRTTEAQKLAIMKYIGP
ncbi:hypothetical protein N7492_008966 [Penicillium capsulatum]|uniref:Uncharacterized protein n=1 Tax=Penicillium capsulatum TaxID=69766 RepID=A0A9W9LHG7_9EURO|nr:hypothetical protein N7492_008966 [Penicillium capsulatum]KAJ6106367.1 hypothetical protein N7512_009884 [Penicillium capsulatum]